MPETNGVKAFLETLESQLEEFNEICAEAQITEETGVADERLKLWKERTKGIIAERLGKERGDKFARAMPGLLVHRTERLKTFFANAEPYSDRLKALIADIKANPEAYKL